MKHTTMRELYIAELRDIHDGEQQLLKALPKLAKAANSPELRNGFEGHLEQTKNHSRRIEQILESIGESPKGKKCKGIQGIISEGSDVMDEDYKGGVMDAALIGAAQRAEHYEIAAYGTLRTFANLLGETEASRLLEQTLSEEKETDRKLTELSERVNPQAVQETESRRAARAGS